MTVTVHWDNPHHTTLRIACRGRWTWQAFSRALEQAELLATTVTHRVHIIVEFYPCGNYPDDGLMRLPYLLERMGDSQRLFVIVGADGEMDIFVKAFSRASAALHNRIFIASTLAEARALLKVSVGHSLHGLAWSDLPLSHSQERAS